MSGMQEWKIRKSVLCASIISSHHINQSPAQMLTEGKRGKGGDMKWQEGGKLVEKEAERRQK